jgi:hypothetical protein
VKTRVVNAVPSGAICTRSSPMSSMMGQSRSTSCTERKNVPSEVRGATFFAANATA